MNREEIIKSAEEFVRNRMKGYDSGHDWWHIERVRGIARFINETEVSADPFILDIAAILHDTADSKFAGKDIKKGYDDIAVFMDNNGLKDIRDRVIESIMNISFSNKNPSGDLSDPLFQILQDADRLDAIGAIGIARAFNYGGFRNNVIFNPQHGISDSSTVNHFHEKLLLLKGRMNTLTGKKLAEERHDFLEIFLERFHNEWEFAIGVKS